jgi:small neutral amino acid transporter SnatA (MarC family)
MQQEMKKDVSNKVFLYTLGGAALFAAAFGFTIANLPGIASLDVFAVLGSCLLTLSSITLISKAIWRDRQRPAQG